MHDIVAGQSVEDVVSHAADKLVGQGVADRGGISFGRRENDILDVASDVRIEQADTPVGLYRVDAVGACLVNDVARANVIGIVTVAAAEYIFGV